MEATGYTCIGCGPSEIQRTCGSSPEAVARSQCRNVAGPPQPQMYSENTQ